jgi:hypothetical protein
MKTSDVVLLPRSVEVQAVLQAREEGGERILEGRIVPFGVVSMVRDMDARTRQPIGAAYRETIVGIQDTGADQIVLEWPGHRGPIAGRSFAVDARDDGAHASFRMLRTHAGDDMYELAREGLVGPLSIEIDPSSPSKRRPDGVVERMAIVRRVAGVEKGAYPGAQITAVRADPGEGEMPPTETAPASAPDPIVTAAPGQPIQPRAATLGQDGSVTPVGEGQAFTAPLVPDSQALLQARQAAERQAAQQLRSSIPWNDGGRGEVIYRPGATDERGRRVTFLWDLAHAHENRDAAERMGRHYAMLEDAVAPMLQRESYDGFAEIILQRTGVWVGENGRLLARAGDVLSSEVPGAYPNNYLPGLLTPRILKGRPMGGFYQRVPVSDARPQIFPKVSTSTTVAVQSAEGANPAASDFATTAVTATPLLYGAETVISRQVLDGASPAAESMVLDDMNEAYAQASEAVIKTAVEAGSTDSGVAITAATPFAGVQANVINYYAVRFRGAGAIFGPTAGFTTLLSENDTTGRPKLPWLGAINSDGVVDAGAGSGAMLGAAVKLAYQATTNVWVFGVPADFVIYESPIARFSYDAVTGPSGQRVGIWAYLVVGARLGSLKKTAA